MRYGFVLGHLGFFFLYSHITRIVTYVVLVILCTYITSFLQANNNLYEKFEYMVSKYMSKIYTLVDGR